MRSPQPTIAHRGTGYGLDHALAERALAALQVRQQVAMYRAPVSFVRSLCSCLDPECREYQLGKDHKAAGQVARQEPSAVASAHEEMTGWAWFLARHACLGRRAVLAAARQAARAQKEETP